MRKRWFTIFITICLLLMAGCSNGPEGQEIYQGKGGIESRTLYSKLLELAGKREDQILFADDFRGLGELRISGESNFAGMELLDLSSVESLTLVRCNLTNGVLPDFVMQMGRLKRLAVEDCGLMSIPEEIAACASLRELSLRGNQLSTLPNAMLAMERLNLLDLSENHFHDIPAELQQMNQLVHLDLSGNDIVSLDGITGPNQLDTLNLSDNHLKTLPESLLRMDKLQVLLLSGNEMTELPLFLNNFAYLAYVDVSGNTALVFDELDFPSITIFF
mgnify:FL=1